MLLEHMTWADVEALPRNKLIVICNLAALEQHSLHLPMATDYFIGSEIVRRIEQQMPTTLLCLPSMWLGCSSHHLDFAGTISASPQTLDRILHDITDSVARHGFDKLLFLNSHGGNRATMAYSIQQLGVTFPKVTIVGTTYWEIANADLSKIRATGFGGMGHACELETSIMLSARRELVDMSKADSDGVLSLSDFSRHEMLSNASVAVYKSMTQMSRHGGYGDPRSANTKKGEAFLDVIVKRLAALCEDLLAGRI